MKSHTQRGQVFSLLQLIPKPSCAELAQVKPSSAHRDPTGPKMSKQLEAHQYRFNKKEICVSRTLEKVGEVVSWL